MRFSPAALGRFSLAALLISGLIGCGDDEIRLAGVADTSVQTEDTVAAVDLTDPAPDTTTTPDDGPAPELPPPVAPECDQCDDGLPCTLDRCDGGGECLSPKLIAGSWCLIGGTCYADGDTNPANPCQACVTPVGPTAWSASDGAACDDGLECTDDDACADGICQGGPSACDDDNPCTTNGCKEGDGCIHAAINGGCEDGDFCTVGDSCTNGVCNAGSNALDCSDGDPCTQDQCLQSGGCDHIPHSGPCDDGNPCSLGDACSLGECSAGSQVPDCNDDDDCTDDQCKSAHGCVHVPNLADCDNGDVCSLGDTCSDGECTAGFFAKDCDDGDACTVDLCAPFQGCQAVASTGPCDDGNPCTSGDWCTQGFCQGSTPTACDDGNPCTDDVCDAKQETGCVFVNNEDPCEDGDICTISLCTDGACLNAGSDCDDGNSCTVDVCEATGCVHAADGSVAGCLLSIHIDTPDRAITLTGSSTISVTGHVVAAAAPLVEASLNGKPLTIAANGHFSTTVKAAHGLNILQAEVTDALGGTDKAARSFYWSTQYKPMNAANPKGSSMAKAIYLYLGPTALDDGDHTLPANDLATIFEILIGSFDIGALLPNPLVANDSYEVSVGDVTFAPPVVQLLPIAGGVKLHATIDNFATDIEADGKCFVCPSASGEITVSQIIISAELGISTSGGQPKVTLTQTDVLLINPDVDINGILGSILDFIVDFVVDQLAPTIEGAFESQLGGIIPDTLEDALASLAFDTSFSLPPFFDGGAAATINLNTGLETTFWTPDGGTLRMWAAATAPKSVPHSVLGVLKRNGCTGFSENLALSQESPLQIALADDLLNQILFSVWRSGALKFPIPPSLLAGQDLSAFGLTELTLELDMLLPPIVSSCNPYNDTRLQVGDIQIAVSAKLFGQPIQMDLFAGVEASASVTADDEGLGLEINGIENLSSEVVVLTPGFGSAEQLVDDLIGENLAPVLLDALGGGALAGFPLPSIDLSGLVAGIPAGTEIAIKPLNIKRSKGWTVVSGVIK